MQYYAINSTMYIKHMGIPNMKWGRRRAKWYPIAAYEAHLKRENKNHRKVSNKYQNIDGSLNEKGIDHRYKFADKKIRKNNKYYDKQINKYQKMLSKTEDDNERKNIVSRIKNAEETRKQVNEYISKMDIEDIVQIENEAKQKVMSVLGTTAGIAATTGLGIAAPRYVAKGIAYTGNFLANLDPEKTIESVYEMMDTEKGQKAMRCIDTGIRSYADVKAYVISTAADQAITRMEQNGTFDKIGDAAEKVSYNTSTKVNNTVMTEINSLLKQYN